MQTMTPISWPAPATPPPPAKKAMSPAAVFFIILFCILVGVGLAGAARGAESSHSTDSGYSYSHGDYPNGWTEGKVNASALGLAKSGVSVETGGCILRYIVDHYTPSEFMANPRAAGTAAGDTGGC